MIEGPYIPKPSCIACSISGVLLGMSLMFVILKAGVVVEEKVLPVRPFELTSPVCPSGVWIGQRIDKWRDGKIVQSYWKHTCMVGKGETK